jgi:hypothetical protein
MFVLIGIVLFYYDAHIYALLVLKLGYLQGMLPQIVSSAGNDLYATPTNDPGSCVWCVSFFVSARTGAPNCLLTLLLRAAREAAAGVVVEVAVAVAAPAAILLLLVLVLAPPLRLFFPPDAMVTLSPVPTGTGMVSVPVPVQVVVL